MEERRCINEMEEVEESEEVVGSMTESVPPSFQHECAVGESKSNLSEPDPESAGDNVRPGIEHQGLEQTEIYHSHQSDTEANWN